MKIKPSLNYCHFEGRLRRLILHYCDNSHTYLNFHPQNIPFTLQLPAADTGTENYTDNLGVFLGGPVFYLHTSGAISANVVEHFVQKRL